MVYLKVPPSSRWRRRLPPGPRRHGGFTWSGRLCAEGGPAAIALRTPRHDVIRRGWLAAILLLFLARSLPLGRQRKCFGGLSIRSRGSASRVALQPPCFRGSELAETLEVHTHPRLDTLAGKEGSAGRGAVINAGPVGAGGRAWERRDPGEPRGEGLASGHPLSSRRRPPSPCLGKSRPPDRGRENGVRPAPCGLQREFRTRRPLPPAPVRPGGGNGARGRGGRRGFPSCGVGEGRDLSLAWGVRRRPPTSPPQTAPGSCGAFPGRLGCVCSAGGIAGSGGCGRPGSSPDPGSGALANRNRPSR